MSHHLDLGQSIASSSNARRIGHQHAQALCLDIAFPDDLPADVDIDPEIERVAGRDLELIIVEFGRTRGFRVVPGVGQREVPASPAEPPGDGDLAKRSSS